ncbi:MAG: creatininase family protein [Ignavibacteriales bacterium]|nr:creatininase family protein [Ignavibacteriales bacterium]
MKSLMIIAAFSCTVYSQDLPSRWDELVASDWAKALEKSRQTCLLPIGILEKHGPHAPIGSDLIHVHEWAKRVTEKEYAVVFPDYFYGQIYEAKHQPGTFALPSRLVWDLLDATCEEIARNGFKKIFIINGHGGNPHLLRYFVQSQLERRRDYVVYYYDPGPDSVLAENIVYTAIWWYASFPNHYAGEGAKASRELGQFMTEARIESMVKALRAVKTDTKTMELQKEFFDRVKK